MRNEETSKQPDCSLQSETENLHQLNELFDELIQLSKELANEQNHDLDEDDDEFSKAFLQLDSNMDFVSNDYNQWIDDLSKSKENVLLQSQHSNEQEQQQQQQSKLFRNQSFNNMLQKFESELSTNVLVNNFNDPMMIVQNDLSV
jgi:hypothetical protein